MALVKVAVDASFDKMAEPKWHVLCRVRIYIRGDGSLQGSQMEDRVPGSVSLSKSRIGQAGDGLQLDKDMSHYHDTSDGQ